MGKIKKIQIAPRLRRAGPPDPILLPPQVMPPNRVQGVVLRRRERVKWIWSVTPDGISSTSGYEIYKLRRPKGGEENPP